MHLLLAEDDPNTRQALADIFIGEGFSVTACPDGKTALAAFQAQAPDLILLDVMMPLMSGYELCRAIRKVNKTVPILFLSAKSEEIDKVAGLDLGADDYITKPFGLAEIKARLRAVLRRAHLIPPEPPFAFGPWQILSAELSALCDERKVELSLLDLKILRFLHQHADRPVSRGQLLEHCWGLSPDTPTRTVDVKISQLRKLLESDPSQPQLIRTQHGLGYCGPG